ncbi:MAG: hypothetical protein AAB578_09325, partial [Elusimicrobiota bacterium]
MNPLFPAILFLLPLLWAAAEGEHDHGGDGKVQQSQGSPDFKLPSEEKPWEDRVRDFYSGMSPDELAQFKNYISNCKDQNAALRSLIEVKESMTELKSLAEKVRGGELSQYEFDKQKEGYFRKMDHSMINGMSRKDHVHMMNTYKNDLDSVGYQFNKDHIKHYQENNPGKDSFQYGADYHLRK